MTNLAAAKSILETTALSIDYNDKNNDLLDCTDIDVTRKVVEYLSTINSFNLCNHQILLVTVWCIKSLISRSTSPNTNQLVQIVERLQSRVLPPYFSNSMIEEVIYCCRMAIQLAEISKGFEFTSTFGYVIAILTLQVNELTTRIELERKKCECNSEE